MSAPRAVPAAAALAPAVGFVAVFALLPVAVLLATSVAGAGGLAGLARVAGDPIDRAALDQSLLQGSLSAAATVAVGYPVGVFLGRYRWRGRAVAEAVLLVPFLLPSLVVVLAVRDLFGSAGYLGAGLPPLRALGGGLGGIVTVNVLFNVPLVALLTAVGVEASSAELEDSAAMLGAGPLARYRDVWGPSSLAGAAAGGLLAFLFSALAFAAPLLLCGPRCFTLEAQVWSLDTVLLAPDAAGVLALLLVVVLAAPAAAYLALVVRLRRRPGRSRRRPVPWGSPAAVGLAAVVAGVLALTGAVLAAVVARSLLPPRPGAAVGAAWGALLGPRVAATEGVSAAGALVNSLAFAIAAAAIAVLLGVVAGFAAVHRPRATGAAQFVVFLPLLVSPIVLAFGLAAFFQPAVGVDATWLLIVVSQATLALPFVLQSLTGALLRRPAAPRETARLLGAGRWRAYLDADLAAAFGAVVAATLFAFALGLGEFTATYFLATPAFATLPVLLYGLEGSRQFAAADAAGALLLVVSLLVFLGLAAGGRRVAL